MDLTNIIPVRVPSHLRDQTANNIIGKLCQYDIANWWCISDTEQGLSIGVSLKDESNLVALHEIIASCNPLHK